MRDLTIVLIPVFAMALGGAVHAAAVPGQGTWETTLLGRDIDGQPVDSTDPRAVFAYDTVLDATWYLTANNDGLDWGDARRWVATLKVGAFGGWTLPALVPNCQGFNCADSQMAELYYRQLGNPANPQGGEMSNTGPFRNLASNYHWTATELIWTTPSAWYFNTYDGYQSQFWQSDRLFALAIRPGDVLVAVPEPGTTMLLLAGGAAALILGRRARRQSA